MSDHRGNRIRERGGRECEPAMDKSKMEKKEGESDKDTREFGCSISASGPTVGGGMVEGSLGCCEAPGISERNCEAATA